MLKKMTGLFIIFISFVSIAFAALKQGPVELFHLPFYTKLFSNYFQTENSGAGKDIDNKGGIHPPSSRMTSAKAATGLNMRNGVGTNHDVIHVLNAGDIVSILQVYENNWGKIKHITSRNRSIVGYVNTKYLVNALERREKEIAAPVASQKSKMRRTFCIDGNCKEIRVVVKVEGKLTEVWVTTRKNRRDGTWGF